MYGYVPERVLDWNYRRQLILDEIQELDADFVCLQELDKHSYDEFFRSALSVKGYKGFYGQKSRAETLGENAKYVDGCGTFWKDKKYVNLHQEHIVLGRKAIARPGAKASADMLNRVWQRDDISTVCLFENRVSGTRIIVVNSHLFWNPAFKDVKLIQAAVLMEELTKLSKKYAEWPSVKNKQVFRFSDEESEPLPEPGPSMVYKSGIQIPMVICGDFNSSAGSALYDLFTKRTLAADHEDLSGRNYGSFSSDGMAHQFTIKSAYKDIDEQMAFTNYTPNFTATLDYIWFSSNSLSVIGLHGEIDQEYLKKVPGFPNFHFPSDHLALMAEFKVEKLKQIEEVKADFGPGSKR